MSDPLYSVVVPVFNSSATLLELCARVASVFEKIGAEYELILVNDNSKDNSWERIKEAKQKYGAALVGINLRKNSGQHKALLCGFQFARGQYVITIDDDLQFYPEDIELLIRHIQETAADMVYGTYANGRQHPRVRQWGSGFMQYVFEKFGNTVGEGSSFRIIRQTVIEKVKFYNHSYTFIDEILSWHTTKIAWQPVRHAARKDGKSGYNIIKLVLLSLNLIFLYTTIPLRFMTWFGLTSFWVCLGLVIYFIFQKITLGSPLGFTTLIVSIFMSTGLILFSLGIIGEYLNRLLALQHRKPPYLIREILR